MRGGEDVCTGTLEAQVDQVAELWGITDKKLQEIRRSLAELGSGAGQHCGVS